MRVLLALSFLINLISACFGQSPRTIYDGDVAMQAKDYAKAIEFYEKALTEGKSKHMYYVHYKKAFCHYSLNQNDQSEVHIKKALKIKKNYQQYNWITGNSIWLRARILSKSGDYMKSLEYLREATKYIQPSLLYSTIAFEEIVLKQYDSALENLNLAIELDGKNAYAFSNRALLFIYQKNYERARFDINKSISLDASNPYVFKHSAMLYIELNQLELACEELAKAEELDYASFGNEFDANEVAELQEKHCKSE